jgi:hypothetical protein
VTVPVPRLDVAVRLRNGSDTEIDALATGTSMPVMSTPAAIEIRGVLPRESD